MTWPFQTLRILYPALTIFSLINISLLSAWISFTNSFSTSFDSYYNNKVDIENKPLSPAHSKINFPIEIYLELVFTILSFLFTVILCFPTISRRFGYNIIVFLTDITFSIFWLINSIIIVSRVNNGSIIDSENINKQLSKEINELPSKEGIPDINKSLSLGKAITALSWIQFVVWTFTTILLAHVRSRKWTKKDQNKRITIVSGQYDQDAKMLNTPAIIKEIDELVKNPPTVQVTKESSSKTPVLELNLSFTSNTTTLYSLDPVSTPHGNSEDLYSRALYDYK